MVDNHIFVWEDFIAKDQQKAENNIIYKKIKLLLKYYNLQNIKQNKTKRKKITPASFLPPLSPYHIVRLLHTVI